MNEYSELECALDSYFVFWTNIRRFSLSCRCSSRTLKATKACGQLPICRYEVVLFISRWTAGDQGLQQQSFYPQSNQLTVITDSSVAFPNNINPQHIIQSSHEITINPASATTFVPAPNVNEGVIQQPVNPIIREQPIQQDGYVPLKRIKIGVWISLCALLS